MNNEKSTIDFVGIPKYLASDNIKLTVDVPDSFQHLTFASPDTYSGDLECEFVDDADGRAGSISKMFEQWAELLYAREPVDPLKEFRQKSIEAISAIQKHDFDTKKVFTCNITELEHWSSGIPDQQFLRDYISGTVVVFVPVVKPVKMQIIQKLDKQLSAYLSKLADKKVSARYCYAIISKFEKNGVQHTKPDMINNFIIIQTLMYGYPKSISFDSTDVELTDGTVGHSALVATSVLDAHSHSSFEADFAGYNRNNYFAENSEFTPFTVKCDLENNGKI